MKVAIFFWCNFSVKLPWVQRRGNKLNSTLFDRYYSQTCKAIKFRIITNHTNINKLMFQVIFTFSDRILIKQHSFFHPFCLGKRKQIYKKHYLEFWLEDWGMSKNVYKTEKTQQAFWREINSTGNKEIWKDISLRLIFNYKSGKQHCLQICWF